ncbi:MAG TPA: GNAT family N-acetyltransferase [Pseudogracilibacillus sp.]|nr:GNAT family N-acetyltransferase [Pseudogracilibacillus sp.]
MVRNNIEIRSLTTIEELKQMQAIESLVWKMDPIPLHHTYTTMKNGGIILGAFDAHKMIGFLYSFPGFKKRKIHLCSHMLGILPEYRMSGVGEAMKLYQAELAKEQGYPMITWTFDPLESRNAYLNIHKLEAVGAVYQANYYGSMDDELNKGLPSDRIQIEWHVNHQKKRPDYAFDATKLLLDINEAQQPILTEVGQALDEISEDLLFIAIPKEFQTIKQNDFELAKAWRSKTSILFEKLFELGFIATDLMTNQHELISYYVFTKSMEE